MNGKKLISLAILAVILGGLAYYTSINDRKKPAVKTGTPLFEDVPLNDIAQIDISKESESITLSNDKGMWTCADKQDYPVKYDSVRSLILKIADIKIGHQIPADGQQLSEIGMILPPADGSGTLVEMRDSNGKLIESLLIGAAKESSLGVGMMKYPAGTFVSDDKGKNIYLVKDTFTSASPSPKAWLDNKLLNIPTSEIKEISVNNPDGKPIDLIDNEGVLQVKQLGRKEVTDATAVNDLTYMLGNLRFDDIADAQIPEDKMGFSDPVELTAYTKKGIRYTLKIGSAVKGRAERYARLSAELVETLEDAAKDNDENLTEEQKDTAQKVQAAKEQENKKLREEVMEMNNRFSKWTYTLATHKTDSITLAYENMITTKE
jgi:hypothetical protein